jgi:S1-C subfamily serine protease
MFRLFILTFLILLLPAAAARADVDSERSLDPAVSAAVVRVELAVDPASAGPQLAAELAARQPWRPYEAEIARRLRVGSTGTGFFVNSRGDVVTNAHVLLSGVRYRGLHFSWADWDSMTLLLKTIRDIWITVREGKESRTYLAVPVVIAEELDLAVVQVCLPPGEEARFPWLAIGDSDGVRVGDSMLALGFPEDEFTADEGKVLALIRGTRVHEDMQLIRRVAPESGEEIVTVSGTSDGAVVRLQHSAPTGHGSSGGPLLDSGNRVIGVAYALLGARGPEGASEPPRTDLNLGIASNVLKRCLRSHAVPFTEASP